MILSATVEKALVLSRGDEAVASSALVVVDGKANRLPQCINLLRKYHSDTVRVAYDLKDDLDEADLSLRQLCRLVEHTDCDREGELPGLHDLLEEIARRTVSKEQEWYFQHRLRERLEEGHLVEAIGEELLSALGVETGYIRRFPYDS